MSLEKIQEYIKEKEEKNWLKKLAEVFDGDEEKEEDKESFSFFNWLKNDKNLLEYANLYNKPEKLNIWESIKFKLLEVKLSITCPYFADFKNFLEELKRWTDISDTTSGTSSSTTSTETTSESIETWNHTFCGTNVSRIKSEPFQRNSKTGVTWCSKTARFNWYNFGLRLPSWDAYKAGTNPWKDSIQTIPRDRIGKQPKNSWEWIEVSVFKSLSKWNYADIYVESKSNYGHRAAAFRDDSWQWYVLDPYTRVNWRLDNTPKKLEDYISTRKIVKAHVYESKWYKERSDQDDSWSWHEWENR